MVIGALFSGNDTVAEAAFGIARMDKGWQAGAMENMPEFDDSRTFLERAPSEYVSRFWYDSCTYTESTLRYLLDVVGSDRVVLGTDGIDGPTDAAVGEPRVSAALDDNGDS